MKKHVDRPNVLIDFSAEGIAVVVKNMHGSSTTGNRDGDIEAITFTRKVNRASNIGFDHRVACNRTDFKTLGSKRINDAPHSQFVARRDCDSTTIGGKESRRRQSDTAASANNNGS